GWRDGQLRLPGRRHHRGAGRHDRLRRRASHSTGDLRNASRRIPDGGIPLAARDDRSRGAPPRAAGRLAPAARPLREEWRRQRLRAAASGGVARVRRAAVSDNGSVAAATWEQVELARHPDRPYALDYIHAIFGDFFELHGDRLFGDDHAIIGGPAALDHRTVMVIAQQKGRTTAERAMRNFGMANPEGYRKALRLIRQAERFQFPIIAFVDTSGAFPGAGAEERGIAWAIAENLVALAQARVPILTLVLGEGGSGGALAPSGHAGSGPGRSPAGGPLSAIPADRRDLLTSGGGE